MVLHDETPEEDVVAPELTEKQQQAVEERPGHRPFSLNSEIKLSAVAKALTRMEDG